MTNGAASRDRVPRARDGFTLLELMVTVGIIAMLTLLARPIIMTERVQADATAHKVRSFMQQAQRTSLVQQHNVLVSFDTVRERMRIVEDVNNNRELDSGERIIWRPLEEANDFSAAPRRLNGTAGGAVALIGNNIIKVNDYPTVVFRRDGSLSTDLEIYVRSRQSGQSAHRVVTVSAGTGRADWYKFVPPNIWRQGGQS
jgi:prepilin-type N-terminal cleavage/methylation domain-containing protein